MGSIKRYVKKQKSKRMYCLVRELYKSIIFLNNRSDDIN